MYPPHLPTPDPSVLMLLSPLPACLIGSCPFRGQKSLPPSWFECSLDVAWMSPIKKALHYGWDLASVCCPQSFSLSLPSTSEVKRPAWPLVSGSPHFLMQGPFWFRMARLSTQESSHCASRKGTAGQFSLNVCSWNKPFPLGSNLGHWRTGFYSLGNDLGFVCLSLLSFST